MLLIHGADINKLFQWESNDGDEKSKEGKDSKGER